MAGMRGQQATISVLQDNAVAPYAFLVTEFRCKPRNKEYQSDYLGQQEPDFDSDVEGWEGSFSSEIEDADAAILMLGLIDLKKNGLALPNIEIAWNESYPNGGDQSFIARGVDLLLDDWSHPGRTEKSKMSYTFRARAVEPVR